MSTWYISALCGQHEQTFSHTSDFSVICTRTKICNCTWLTFVLSSKGNKIVGVVIENNELEFNKLKWGRN